MNDTKYQIAEMHKVNRRLVLGFAAMAAGGFAPAGETLATVIGREADGERASIDGYGVRRPGREYRGIKQDLPGLNDDAVAKAPSEWAPRLDYESPGVVIDGDGELPAPCAIG